MSPKMLISIGASGFEDDLDNYIDWNCNIIPYYK